MRIQTLQQLRDSVVVILWIIGLNHQKKSVARGERKIRSIEHRVVWLRQFVQNQHAKHCGERSNQHRALKRNRNKCTPTVVWLPAYIDRTVNDLDPVLHQEPANATHESANEN